MSVLNGFNFWNLDVDQDDTYNILDPLKPSITLSLVSVGPGFHLQSPGNKYFWKELSWKKGEKIFWHREEI